LVVVVGAIPGEVSRAEMRIERDRLAEGPCRLRTLATVDKRPDDRWRNPRASEAYAGGPVCRHRTGKDLIKSRRGR
jgi:hypothetical protein